MDLIAADLRRQFPIFERRTYLNSCSYGALCLDVQRAAQTYLQTRHEYGSRWDLWVDELAQLRSLLGSLLRCTPEDIAVCGSVSEAVNALASAFDFQGRRSKIILTDFDFPTTSQIWLAQARRGARLVRAAADHSGTDIPLAAFDQLIDEETLLVSLPYVCYRNGARLDPGPIIELAHARGALVLLDAYQALGTFPIAPAALEVDFLVGGCLKYLLGSAGVGFLYVKDCASSPLQSTATGWFAQADPDAMDIYHHRPAASARRFESGTPAVCSLHMARAGLKFLLEVGLEPVGRQIAALTAALVERVDAHGWCLATPAEAERHGAMMAIKSSDAPALVARLAEAGIVVSDRDGNVRVSPHFYNNARDLEHLFEVFEANADLLIRRAV